MKIKQMEVGPIMTNCYIVENEETRHGVLIDPGDDGDRIRNVSESFKWI